MIVFFPGQKRNTMKKTILFLLPLVCALSGCELLYDVQQDRTEDGCKRLLQPDERAACLKRNQTSYDQYERDRVRLTRGHSEKGASAAP
jgi:hypothetical protein